MKQLKLFGFLMLIIFSTLSYSQERAMPKKIRITGKVTDKLSGQELEYATIIFQNDKRPEILTGGITNSNGDYDIEIVAGTYSVKFEFISFKSVELKQKSLQEDTNLGTIVLTEDATMLNEVEVRADRSTVEIKLDKRVYNVGQDMLVKGGTISDVLDNVPSVSVDVEGNVSLRGNDNVRILIDGKPSGIIGINVAAALKLIPAESIDKVEVITNPSARYDAEGGGGIINIILKKGKNQGLNGVFTASVGDPESYGLSGNLNYKSESFNLFTTQGYNYRVAPGNSITNTEYLNSDGTTKNYIYETRKNERLSEGYNGNFGFEWSLDKNTTWTNTFSYRKNGGDNPDNVLFNNFDANSLFQFSRARFNNQKNYGEDVDLSTNLIKKFKKDGHQLTFDGSFSANSELDNSTITDNVYGNDRTINDQSQKRHLAQTDYVLPIGDNHRFEVGYRGDFTEVITDYSAEHYNSTTSNWDLNSNISNILEYKEKINAFYTQYGFKVNKLSYLFGLRWEDSNIEVNQLVTNDYNTKKYNYFFPSAFINYEISEKSSTSLSYSRRIQRPRGRFMNPFPNLSSNINIFQGNPDIDPALTHAIDLGYIKRWDKLTFSTSAYFNLTQDSFQFTRRESGEFVETIVGGQTILTPIILSSPINLANQYRTGFEFTLNYSPYKWWKLNGNFNFFSNETKGEFKYTNFVGTEVVQNFDNKAFSWFARVSSKVTLPYKIDWQTNGTYNAPQNTAQGRSLGILSANLAFSKDVLKDKGTIALNVSDLFNSRKRIVETNLPNILNSYNEMQFRQRQLTLSFTYRFNKKKNERERQPRREDGGDGDIMG